MEQHCKNNDGTPFSLYIGWGPPHNGHSSGYGPDDTHELYDQYPGKYNVYDPAKIKLRPNVPRPLAPFTRTEIADYYSNVTGLDDQMGRLMNKLEELGISENTIVCFSSAPVGVRGGYTLQNAQIKQRRTKRQYIFHLFSAGLLR